VSFRARLLLTSLATLAIGLGALVVAGNVVLNARVKNEASNLLRAHAEAQMAALSVTRDAIAVRAAPNDAALDRRAWVLDGDRVIERADGVTAAMDRAAVALGRARRPREVEAVHDVRFRVVPIVAPGARTARGAVVVALSVAPLETLQKEVLVGSLVIAALVLLAGGLALRTAIDHALQPVAQMTESAADWGAHDLDRRFDLGPARDELTGLAATLDGLLGRIAASRRHEQRFAADVAHELRTPIAGLRGRAELALTAEGPTADAERAAALTAVVAGAERLTTTVDTLLAVARRELDPAGGSVDLEALAREHESHEDVGGVRVVVVAPPGGVPHAEGEPEIIRRALAPLVENAQRFAESLVTLELSATADVVRVTVRDDGPGLPPDLHDPFQAGSRGPDSPGAGLGLPLARRMAHSCGGDVRLGPSPGGCFVLELPASA
jgi:signal transduction histidine kinase